MKVLEMDMTGAQTTPHRTFGKLIVASFDRLQRTLRAEEPDHPLVMLEPA